MPSRLTRAAVLAACTALSAPLFAQTTTGDEAAKEPPAGRRIPAAPGSPQSDGSQSQSPGANSGSNASNTGSPGGQDATANQGDRQEGIPGRKSNDPAVKDSEVGGQSGDRGAGGNNLAAPPGSDRVTPQTGTGSGNR